MIPVHHPLASVRDVVQRGVHRGRGRRRAHALRARRRRRADCVRVARRPHRRGEEPGVGRPRVPRSASSSTGRSARSTTTESPFYLLIEVADQPGVLAAIAGEFGASRRVDQVDGAARHRRRRPPRVHHAPGARGGPAAPRSTRCATSSRCTGSARCCASIGRRGLTCAAAPGPGSSRRSASAFPSPTPRRSSPCSRATRRSSTPRGSPRGPASRACWLKIEGANPTGSFKDRGMTMAVSWRPSTAPRP